MKSESLRIAKLFQNGGDIHYVLPLFQREYTWEKPQWQTLLDDAIAIHDEMSSATAREVEHFLGSVVVINDGTRNGTVPAFQVVDGQQRLTTISLLLCAFGQCLGKEHASLNKKIRRLLVNADEEGEVHFKLLPTAKFGDRTSYTAILSGEGTPVPDSRVTQAHEFFRRELTHRLNSPTPLDPDRLFVVLTQAFQVVFIDLNRDESPYQIFESLNGKGKPLSQADLVRNYIAMRLSPKGQDKVFHSQWAVIEDKLRDHRLVGRSRLGELTGFLRHYMAMETGVLCSEEHVYARFRDRSKERFPDETTFATEIGTLRRFADLYDRLLRPEGEPSVAVQSVLKRLNVLEASTTFPFLLAAYNAHLFGVLGEPEWIGILQALENYLVRRHLADETTNYLNRLFANLWHQITEEAIKTGTDLLTTFKSYLAVRNYPSAARLRQRLANRSLYDTSSLTRQRTVLILETINRHLSVGTGGYTVLNNSATIEHILPQEASEDWLETLGPDAERIHREYLHTFGNLTLVTQDWNSSLSNKLFTIKRHRLATHALRINADYFSQDIPEWNEEAILARCNWLVDKVLEVWPSLANDDADTLPTQNPAESSRFNIECIARIEANLRVPLVKKSRTTFSSSDDRIRVMCTVSKEYVRSGIPQFWYAFQPYQQTFLQVAEHSYVAFGCGSAQKVVLIPFREFEPCLEKMNQSIKGDKFYWHVFLQEIANRFYLMLQQGEKVDVSDYLLIDASMK